MEVLWIKSDNVGGRGMANGRHKNLFAGPEQEYYLYGSVIFLYRESYLWDSELRANNKTHNWICN